jgi:hypothetical protein
VSEESWPPVPPEELVAEVMRGRIEGVHLAWLLQALIARIEALEARNYQYSRELDTVLLRIRDDYNSTDH